MVTDRAGSSRLRIFFLAGAINYELHIEALLFLDKLHDTCGSIVRVCQW